MKQLAFLIVFLHSISEKDCTSFKPLFRAEYLNHLTLIACFPYPMRSGRVGESNHLRAIYPSSTMKFLFLVGSHARHALLIRRAGALPISHPLPPASSAVWSPTLLATTRIIIIINISRHFLILPCMLEVRSNAVARGSPAGVVVRGSQNLHASRSSLMSTTMTLLKLWPN